MSDERKPNPLKIQRNTETPNEQIVRDDWSDPDFIAWRVRRIYNAICKWPGKHSQAKYRCLLFLRQLGESITEIDLSTASDAMLNDWFESYRFVRQEEQQQRPRLRRPAPPMTISEAASHVSESENWQSVDDLEPPPTARRRLNFDSPAVSTPDLPECANCFRNVYECRCLESHF